MTRENRGAVKTVLQNSPAPIAATQIGKELPKPSRMPLKELVILLHEMAVEREIFLWPRKKFWDRDPQTAAPPVILRFLAEFSVAAAGRIKGALGLPLELLQPALRDLVGAGRLYIWQPGKTPYYCLLDPEEVAHERILKALADGPLSEKDLAAWVKRSLPGYQVRHLRQHVSSIEQVLVHPKYGKEKIRYGLKPPEPGPYLSRAVLEIVAVQRLLAPFHISLEAIYDALRRQLKIEQRGTTVERVAGEVERSSPAVEQLIMEKIPRLQPLGQRRALVSIRELRRSLGLPKGEFDKAVFSLALRGRVALHQHDFPSSLGPAERDELLRDEQGTYYVGIVPKEMS
ncbi:MAG: hypothetical protein AB1512_26150 [Thermodesulfobacteriota bacterium]